MLDLKFIHSLQYLWILDGVTKSFSCLHLHHRPMAYLMMLSNWLMSCQAWPPCAHYGQWARCKYWRPAVYFLYKMACFNSVHLMLGLHWIPEELGTDMRRSEVASSPFFRASSRSWLVLAWWRPSWIGAGEASLPAAGTPGSLVGTVCCSNRAFGCTTLGEATSSLLAAGCSSSTAFCSSSSCPSVKVLARCFWIRGPFSNLTAVTDEKPLSFSSLVVSSESSESSHHCVKSAMSSPVIGETMRNSHGWQARQAAACHVVTARRQPAPPAM